MNVFMRAVPRDDDTFKVDLDTLLVLHIFNLCNNSEAVLNVVYTVPLDNADYIFNIGQVRCVFKDVSQVPRETTYCTWPLVVDRSITVAGLCSVSRHLIKSSNEDSIKDLLGYKESCLIASCEASWWTKFCEIEVIAAVKDLIKTIKCNGKIYIPVELSRFEKLLSQPVRMHNIYKAAREQNNDKQLPSGTPVNRLNLCHSFAEGCKVTLSDMLLHPCFEIIFGIMGTIMFKSLFPLVAQWFRAVNVRNKLLKFATDVDLLDVGTVIFKLTAQTSAFHSEIKCYTRPKISTKQEYVAQALRFVRKDLKLKVRNDIEPFGFDVEFDWEQLPPDVSPESGALPENRAGRKREQLENLARAVIKLSKGKRHRIVDFCSGSGHLGILLAALLPDCHIILIENKEMSMARAEERVAKLNLSNVTLLQCNVDYFECEFDVGVSLHACNVATDLVIQTCIDNRAHFVCCPCCYGGIQDCHRVSYPRSDELRSIKRGYYFSIAHAADQTHDDENMKTKQGFLCMDVIDTDRKLHAEKLGYTVYLGKLQPVTCTVKNNLLVGIYR